MANLSIPQLSNRPNAKIATANGKHIYHSRACALVAEVFLFSQKLNRWKSANLPALSLANCNPGKAADVAWVPLEKALTMNLAFKHSSRLQELWSQDAELFASFTNSTNLTPI